MGAPRERLFTTGRRPGTRRDIRLGLAWLAWSLQRHGGEGLLLVPSLSTLRSGPLFEELGAEVCEALRAGDSANLDGHGIRAEGSRTLLWDRRWSATGSVLGIGLSTEEDQPTIRWLLGLPRVPTICLVPPANGGLPGAWEAATDLSGLGRPAGST